MCVYHEILFVCLYTYGCLNVFGKRKQEVKDEWSERKTEKQTVLIFSIMVNFKC